MKALLLSVRPEHAFYILQGNKKRELRKSVPKGFKGWVYVYVTKGKPTIYKSISRLWVPLNGTIPFRFWFDEYEKMYTDYSMWVIAPKRNEEILKMACLSWEDADKYSNHKLLYAWHIKNLDIFSEPMKLCELQNYMPKDTKIPEWAITSSWQIHHAPLEKAPPSYMYVYVKEELK